MIYLDNAATTQIDSEVLDAMMPYLTTEFGNAGSIHKLGMSAKAAIEKARAQVAEMIKCSPEHIIFTSGGSEANNMVFYGLRNYLKENGKTHIITSAQEHDSVLNAVKNLCIKDGFHSSFVPTNKNTMRIESEDLQEMIQDDTGLVSVMSMNNETGICHDVAKISKVLHDNGILFHTDCVQGATYLDLDVEEIGCDFLSISAHKINAPKGIGALYVKNKELIQPIIYGGSEQEFGLRGGTENVAGIVGFGKACEMQSRLSEVRRVSVMTYKTTFINTLMENLKAFGIENFHINNATEHSHKIVNIRFDGIDSETLVMYLAGKGLCVSAGSACRSHESEPSYVLKDLGLSDDEVRDSIRISFSHRNTMSEAVEASYIISESVDDLIKCAEYDNID